MRVLVTGALGSIGMASVRALIMQGHRVRTFDLYSRAKARRLRELAGPVDAHWGDIRNADQVAAAVADQDAVVHLAAILFPDSEVDPERSQSINVGGTRNVLAAMRAGERRPAIVFPSSIAVYGAGRFEGAPRRVSDPLSPGTHYSHHKVACEEMIRRWGLPWSILRIGAAIEPGASAKVTPLALQTMLGVSLATRIEWVHPDDVGRAVANVVERPETRSNVWMIGGGEACRATQRDFFSTALSAVGLGMFPDEAFGSGAFEMDWMETEESERALAFQRHNWADFHADFQTRMKPYRWALHAIRPIAERGLVRRSLVRASLRWQDGAQQPAPPVARPTLQGSESS
jgi:nucleoside-diphosphate-sugar epimerase